MKKKRIDSSEFVTKGFLKSELKRALDVLESKVDENARGYRDQILTKLDGVMGELKTIREETTIGTHQVFELQERVDNHEERITHLEESKLLV